MKTTDLRLIREDVTNLWDEELRQKHGVTKIFDYFVVNANQLIYLCELTPSVERWPFHSEFIGKDDEAITDEGWEEFYANNHTENDYVHFQSVRDARKVDLNFDYEDEEEYQLEMESVLDYLQGNPITW
jgi:hypothetical protein